MKKEKQVTLALMAFLVIGLASFAFLLTPATPVTTSSGTGQTIYGFLNEITVEHCSAKTGECEIQSTHNVVTREGVNWTRDVISGLHGCSTGVNVSCYVNWTVLELSGDASVGYGNASCTGAITGNALDIKQATTIYRTNEGNFSMNASWTKTGGATQTVRRICVTNNTATASTDLMAVALLTSEVNLGTSDQLTISYAIAFVNGTA